MCNGMPVSVKVYFGQGSAMEIRRFMFRADTVRQSTAHHSSSHHHPSQSSHQSQQQQQPNVYLLLLEKIRALYNGLNLHDVNLCWKDDDSDYVVFSSDDELKVAINNTTDNTLRIYIREKELPTRSGTFRRSVERTSRSGAGEREASTSQRELGVRERDLTPNRRGRLTVDVDEEPGSPGAALVVNHVQHSSTLCSECEGEGRGVWYKCTVCTDYFLCSDCENRGLHDQHIMVRTTTGASASPR